jgi:hypothetical protein
VFNNHGFVSQTRQPRISLVLALVKVIGTNLERGGFLSSVLPKYFSCMLEAADAAPAERTKMTRTGRAGAKRFSREWVRSNHPARPSSQDRRPWYLCVGNRPQEQHPRPTELLILKPQLHRLGRQRRSLSPGLPSRVTIFCAPLTWT